MQNICQFRPWPSIWRWSLSAILPYWYYDGIWVGRVYLTSQVLISASVPIIGISHWKWKAVIQVTIWSGVYLGWALSWKAWKSCHWPVQLYEPSGSYSIIIRQSRMVSELWLSVERKTWKKVFQTNSSKPLQFPENRRQQRSSRRCIEYIRRSAVAFRVGVSFIYQGAGDETRLRLWPHQTGQWAIRIWMWRYWSRWFYRRSLTRAFQRRNSTGYFWSQIPVIS